MHLLLCHWIDGKAFFAGVGLLVLTALVSGSATAAPRRRLFATAAAALGLGCIATSGTPLTVSVWLVLLTGCALWVVGYGGFGALHRRQQIIGRVALLGAALITLGVELPYHVRPSLPGPKVFDRVMVIGDSVSAGIGSKGQVTWPLMLTRNYDIEMLDVAFAVATVAGALQRQLSQLAETSGLLILEIGGNDLLGSRPLNEFEITLDQLLREAQQPGRTIVMFELPAPPTRTGYTAVQRRLARRHGVCLIPRRYFLKLIRHPANTVDGIHLTDRGQAVLFQIVVDLLGDRLMPERSIAVDDEPGAGPVP